MAAEELEHPGPTSAIGLASSALYAAFVESARLQLLVNSCEASVMFARRPVSLLTAATAESIAHLIATLMGLFAAHTNPIVAVVVAKLAEIIIRHRSIHTWRARSARAVPSMRARQMGEMNPEIPSQNGNLFRSVLNLW